jgi:hypothetical protein
MPYYRSTKGENLMKVTAAMVDSFHSLLMADDEFMEAVQRVALELAESSLAEQPCEHDEDDVYDLAMELVCRTSVA